MRGHLPKSPELLEALVDNTLMTMPKKSLRKGGVYGKANKTLLHLAVKYSSSNEVLLYCVNTLKVNPQKAASTRSLPIHVSCKYGKLEAATLLLSLYEACLDKCDATGESPLGVACKYGQQLLAELLIESGASVHSKNKQQWTPLHWASRNGHTSLVEILVKNGARCTDITRNKENCLHLAVQSRNIETVALLLPITNHKVISDYGTIFHVSRENPVMLDYLIKNSEWNKFPKLPILLEICAPTEIIIDNCRSELCGNSLYYIQVYDRADLLNGLYVNRIACIEELVKMSGQNLNPKCKALIDFLARWNRVANLLLVYTNCESNTCIKRLPVSLLRECVAYL